MAFSGLVPSAAYSGLATHLPGKPDLRRLNAAALGFTRVALRDRRPEIDPAYPESKRADPRHKTRPELLSLRLRQWLSFVRYPSDCAQALTAPFGSLEGLVEPSTFTDFGRIVRGANPGARQFEQDLDALQHLRGGP
eukprot:764541-Pyramimonas_sp.AAC.1